MNFKEKLDKSFGTQLIVTGLARLVEEEGHTPHEAFNLLEEVKRNTFHALAAIKSEVEPNAETYN